MQTVNDLKNLFQQRSVQSEPVTTPIPLPTPTPTLFASRSILSPMSISIPRPIILHGIHPPASSPTIIRLQRPITIPSALFTLPPAVTHSPSPLPTSSNMMHQFIPGLRPPLPQQDFPTKLPGDLEAEEDEDDEQSAQAADTYSDYMPLKRR